MKVTIFVSSLHGGGAERTVCTLASELAQRGMEVDVMYMVNTGKQYLMDDRVRKVPLFGQDEFGRCGMKVVKQAWRLLRYVLRTDTRCYVSFLSIPSIILLLAKPLLRRPLIVAERSYPPIYGNGIQRMLKAYSKRAEMVLCQSDEIREWYVNAGCMRVEIVRNAVAEPSVKWRGKGSRKVVAVGRICEAKNYPLLIDAFARFVEVCPGYDLFVYGAGDSLALEAQCKDRGVLDVVHFLGFCSNTSTHINDAEMFVMSSKYEGMPNALMEAMAIGLPCISTDFMGGAARMLIDNEMNGLIVPNNNPEALANAMVRLAKDDRLKEAISDNAIKKSKNYSPKLVYDRWYQLIKNVCNE